MELLFSPADVRERMTEWLQWCETCNLLDPPVQEFLTRAECILVSPGAAIGEGRYKVLAQPAEPLALFRHGEEFRALIGRGTAVAYQGRVSDPFAEQLLDCWQRHVRSSRLPKPDEVVGRTSAAPLRTFCPDARVGMVTPLMAGPELRAACERLTAALASRSRHSLEHAGVPLELYEHHSSQLWVGWRLEKSRALWLAGLSSPKRGWSPDFRAELSLEKPSRREDLVLVRADDSLFLAHRGRPGGGLRASEFWRSTRLGGAQMQEDGEGDSFPVALVAHLGSGSEAAQLAGFLQELRRVRRMLTADEALGEEVDEEPVDFLELDEDEQVSIVHRLLLGTGLVDVGRAVRAVACSLRQDGRTDFLRLREGSPLYKRLMTILKARGAHFDHPAKGKVRATLPFGDDYQPREWEMCILEAVGRQQLAREDAIALAATWARDHVGLRDKYRKNGKIHEQLKRALTRCLRKRHLEAVDRDHVRAAT